MRPVNPAGPVENEKRVFFTGPWTRKERAPTGLTGIILF
jgi:hypothetical protein